MAHSLHMHHLASCTASVCMQAACGPMSRPSASQPRSRLAAAARHTMQVLPPAASCAHCRTVAEADCVVSER
eukprot:257340-Chlamydomonas_euryale.AAC.4